MQKPSPIAPEVNRSTPRSASRRSLLAAAGALVANFGLLETAWAQTAATKTSPAKAPQQAIIDATKRCETVGNACLRHCQRLTRLGDKSLADCMRSVAVMLPVCVATNRLAQQDAKRLQDLAKVCADVCRDCEAECRKHEFHHVECKRCAEACAATVKVLAAL
ncbi:MAG TPA: Csp1 family four helix bundle copper storage protein [Hyphomicrobiaceae bacterium]|jgi:Cys-rich four helix bundle protein (predicted Tat secretion target)|nr:Csp1 family four helix bundle copper storage protein [Hyphomicrobiaceae bacterium]